MTQPDPVLAKVVCNREWDCRVCAVGGDWHDPDSPLMKEQLARYGKYEDFDQADHDWEPAICGTCGDQMENLPHMARAKRNGYIGPVCHPDCAHEHRWVCDYDSMPECVRCGADKMEYLERMLTQSNIPFDAQDAAGPEDFAVWFPQKGKGAKQ